MPCYRQKDGRAGSTRYTILKLGRLVVFSSTVFLCLAYFVTQGSVASIFLLTKGSYVVLVSFGTCIPGMFHVCVFCIRQIFVSKG